MKKNKSSTRSMQLHIRIHYGITVVLMVLIFGIGIFLNALIAARYNRILDSNMYYSEYESALREAFKSLDNLIYYNADLAADLNEKVSELYKQAEMLPVRISYEGFSRHAQDLKYMAHSFLTQAGSAKRLAENGYLDAAIPIYQDCERIFGLILQYHANSNSALVEINKQQQNAVNEYRELLLVVNFLLAAVILGGSFHLIVRLIDRTVHPIEILTKQVSETKTSENTVTPLTSIDCRTKEVETLLEAYNVFIDRINKQFLHIKQTGDLEKQLLENEAKNLRVMHMLKASELKALQSQINPHFMFNALNMVTSSAYLEGAEQTTLLMELLGSYLRYNLDYANQTVKISDEVNNIIDYLKIQKVRMGERLEYEVECDRLAAGGKTASFILQPLVENALHHGLNSIVEGGWIKISIAAKNNRVEIRVADNGVGMSKEKVEKLNALTTKDPLSEDNGHGIGIKNVVSRLLLFFDHDIGFEVVSEPNIKTEFILNLPFTLEDINYGI